MITTIEQARDASQRHAWSEAVEAFQAVDASEPLGAEDLVTEAEAAWWNADPEATLAALERAFAAFEGEGRMAEAADVAMSLAYFSFRRLALPVAGGWLARAMRILDTLPESGLHARLELFLTLGSIAENQLLEAIEHADKAVALGRLHGNPDVQYNALSFKGLAEIARGNWQEGLRLIDEAATAVVSGQLNPRAGSDVYCQVISACRSVGDFGRAGQWTTEAERWMAAQSLGGYPGVCQVHRAELKMLHGDLPGAEQQARQACEQLERFQLLFDAGWGHYQLGEVRRRMGDLPAATEAFDKAYAYGHDPEPGLALLQLATGDPDAAERSIQRALAERAGSAGTPDEAGRAELLPAQVEIAIARGDLDEARLATDELERIAGDFTFPVFAANASTARGRLLLAEGNVAEASRVLSRAWRAWQEADLPFESARTRVALAEALRAQGDESAAVRDLNAAREAFARLGAAGELRQVEGMLGTAAQPAAGHRSTKRTFMFTDIVTSTDLLEAIGDDAWEELIEWHDRTLRSAIAEHRGEEVVHTGDGFFAAFATAVDGVESAVDIQRRLARHRREHGFAPWVRIGLHTATATRRGSNYSGRGVHVASRVGAAADREEILVATSVIEAAETIPYPLSDARSLTLKGVQQPVEVRAVDWR